MLQTKLLSEYIYSPMDKVHLARHVRRMLCRLVLQNQLKLLNMSWTAMPFCVTLFDLLFEVHANTGDAELL